MVSISPDEAEKCKPWPLLSRQEKSHAKIMKKSWVMDGFRFLQKEVSQCDLERIDRDPSNYDLCGAVCQLCCIRLSAASDVFRHLVLESHQNKVLLLCHISGTEFNEYYKRLKNVRLEIVRLIDEMINITTSSVPNAKNESTSSNAQIMLMQAAPQRSQELAENELNAEMKKLRQLASTVKAEKFIKLYKCKINLYVCSCCHKKTQGPMEVLSHYLSKRHCAKARECGFRVTMSDIVLWRSQISAGI
nr:unnamed protein product [Haemonchus contortus]